MIDKPAPWHQHPAVIAASVFCCWPVGLVLLWMHPRAPLWAKLLVTIPLVLSTLFVLGAYVDFVIRLFGG